MAGRVGSIVAVNLVAELWPGPSRASGIDKRPRAGRLAVTRLGLVGDIQADSRHHGGVDKALYAYAGEDADWWSEELGRRIPPGLFGENLTTAGVDVTGALLGERWWIGDGPDAVEVEVTGPRIPCANFTARMGIPRWVRRFRAGGRPGAYLRVTRPGTVAAGDPVTVVHRPAHDVTTGRAFRRPTPAQARRLLDSGVDLAAGIRARTERPAAAGRGDRAG